MLIIPIDDVVITKIIFNRFSKEFNDCFNVDVAIAGAGPAGLTAARFLSSAGKKVVVFEKKLSIGGGMWGGGMIFPVIVVQKESKKLLEDVNVKLKDEKNGYFSGDSIESTTKLCSTAIDSGTRILNGICVEDVLLSKDRVNGFVINWSAADVAKLHVDPLTIRAKYCIDATGHAAEICKIVSRKCRPTSGPLKNIEGDRVFVEKSMCADIGEQTVVQNTKEVYPGLFVTGMAANAVFGAPRMGPIFGGMLLSGKKVAEIILKML